MRRLLAVFICVTLAGCGEPVAAPGPSSTSTTMATTTTTEMVTTTSTTMATTTSTTMATTTSTTMATTITILAPGCGRPDEIVESSDFVSVHGRHHPATLPPNNNFGNVEPEDVAKIRLGSAPLLLPTLLPDRFSVQAVQHSRLAENVALLYDVTAPAEFEIDDFLSGGGIFFEVQAAPDASTYLEGVIEMSRSAVAVDIGPYPGMVNWEDPRVVDTFRPHRVLWATEGQLYTMIGDYDAEDLVEMARSTVCS